MSVADSDIQYSDIEELALSQCVLAALWHSRALTLSELMVRLDGIGRKVSEGVLSLAMVDLRDKLAVDPWFPFTLLETGTQWSLSPRHPALETLAGDGKIHLVRPLSDEELMVLSVIVFNGPDGISRTAIHRTMGMDPATAIGRLREEGLVYAIPGESFEYWRPSPEILRRFGLKRFADLPGYREFRAYLNGSSSLPEAEKAVATQMRRVARRQKSNPRRTPADLQLFGGTPKDGK